MTFVAGQKLRASELNDALDPVGDMPLGVIARHRRTTTSSAITASTSSAAIAILRLATPVKAGRLYRVGCPQAAAYCEVSASRSQFVINYTENGTNPTTTSTQLTQSGSKHPDLGFVDFFPCLGNYVPASDLTLTATLYVWRPSGSGNIFCYGAGPSLDFIVEDMGVDPGSSGTTL